jgi:glyceraldehyde 3-phosphate dehydrogenase
MKFGINGFGRIGRTSFRVWWQRFRDQAELVVINTSGSSEIETWAYLLKYDYNYGVFGADIQIEHWRDVKAVTDTDPELGKLIIDGRSIIVTAQRDPAKIPWSKYGVETVIESTGAFLSPEKAGLHLQAGAKRVVLSAPAKEGSIPTTVLGVNIGEGVDQPNTSQGASIISNASCTTNCVAPVVDVIQAKFGIKKAMMTTIHAYTDDQNLHDNSHKDLRRARAAAKNIVPTSTGAARAMDQVIPHMHGIFDGLSMRVPVSVGSLSDMTFLTERPTTVEEVKAAFVEAAGQPRWRGILAVTNDPIVSQDIVGRSESSIVDLALTQVIGGDMVKVISWYDNEFGYCNRLVELVVQH